MKKRFISRVLILALVMALGFTVLPSDSGLTVKVSAAAALSAPTGFSYTSTTDSITLTWDKVKGADAYKVYMLDEGYSDDNQKLYMIGDDMYLVYKSVKGTQCTINDLDKGTEYTFVVSALDKSEKGYIEGKKSGVLNIKTKSDTNTKKKIVKKQTKKSSYPSLWDYGFKDASKITPNSSYVDVRGYTYREDALDMFVDYLKAWKDYGCWVDMDEEGKIDGTYFSGGAVVYKNTEAIAIVVYVHDVESGLSTVSISYV